MVEAIELPLFLQFILKEEEFYRNRYYELTDELPLKKELNFKKLK